ncbi:MAG: glutamine--fructose-6-phosphate transaminase (isomerizing), partial [Candidatus Rokuibacteriota bacterium]
MCGIVGYVGDKSAVDIIVEGLKRLEYRGYDSAGVAVLHAGHLQVRRAAGRLKMLEGVLRERPVTGSLGIGHTRWATHGRPSEENAHPHTDCAGELVVVHNGILENYLEIKERLLGEGHAFRSETDTEVLAHLIEHHVKITGRLESAVKRALAEVRGSYAIGVVATAAPDRLVAAKQGAGSVVVGLGRGEMFVASDIPAILSHTRDVVILEDDDVATITAHGVEVSTVNGEPMQREPVRILWDPIMAEKGGYRHFMLKEIYEQPRAVTDTFRGRIAPETGSVVLPDVNLDPSTVRGLMRVVIVACGTSFHSAMLGRTMIEQLARMPVEIDLGSEFRYRDAVVGPETLVVAISQSGETADTLGAVKAAKLKGCPILAITNVVGSALAREATGTLYTHAGPEIGVASTKAFTTQIVALYLLSLWLGRQREVITPEDVKKRIQDLVEIPRLIESTLGLDSTIDALARRLSTAQDFLYLGRGAQFPIALEGALKLKEISYIHAEGYAGGEMKHGPIALITEGLPVVALAPRDSAYDRMLGNIEEVRARDGLLIAVGHPGDRALAAKAQHVIEVPPTTELLTPLVTVVPLQLLAYHIAVR